jgi:AraC family transcriptional regulator of adaptative response/methylated-DNA-[protein]-cysteine methyltransferase
MRLNRSTAVTTSEGRMWDAVVARDSACDGAFYYSVATTGVYCRPSCPSRLAKRENVRFHATCADAERAGFRACKRCKPDVAIADHTSTRKVTEACRLIREAEYPPSLRELANAVGVSPYHFHRLFKSIVGVTPKAYALAQRQQKVRQTLNRSETVTGAIYDSGYNSSGRFYASAPHVLGMTPTKFRQGGKDTAITFAVGQCWLGAVLVAATAKGVCAILLGDEAEPLVHALQDQFPNAHIVAGDRAFGNVIAAAIALVDRPGAELGLPLDVRGTAFQHRVWQALQQVPAGETLSYTDLAERIGRPKAVRAVARACATNTIAVAIPCHRIVRQNGDLSGYRWGVARKQALLDRERKK